MLAVAGAKGGCGKTTTTLGLSQAFARSGEPTLAVDADRQLPTLHVTADVNREPTIAELVDGRSAEAVAQEVPGESGVGLLPAPLEDETVDYEAALKRLGNASPRVVVDCPSGAGPDVMGPITVADRVLVVSTPTERSISAAETTIDIARRVDVPVAGVVLTCANDVPQSFVDRLDVPILGAIPESETPLDDPAAASAYDEVVRALSSGHAHDGATITSDPGQCPVGIDAIDRALDGGLPAGSVVVLEAEPASSAELLLYRATATRGTLYVSTERSDENVRTALDESVAEVGSPTVRHARGSSQLDEAKALVGELPDAAGLVIDSVESLERTDRDEYTDFLNALQAHVTGTGGVAFLHAPRHSAAPANRALTEQFADVVFRFEAAPEAPDGDTLLSVEKLRGVDAVPDPITLDLRAEASAPVRRDGD